MLDTNTKHMCSLHAHLLLTLRNVPTTALTEGRVTTVVTAVVFLSTRHEWNLALLDRKDGVSSYGGWRIPETEVYEAVHVLRRKVVTWLRERADQRAEMQRAGGRRREAAAIAVHRGAGRALMRRWLLERRPGKTCRPRSSAIVALPA